VLIINRLLFEELRSPIVVQTSKIWSLQIKQCPDKSFGLPDAVFGQPVASFGRPDTNFGMPNMVFGMVKARF
jgi:hypothetical protein